MHPFRFRLATLLKFRAMQKEQAQLTFMQAVTRVKEEQQKLHFLQDRLADALQNARSEREQRVVVEKLKLFEYYFDKLKKDIEKQTQSLEAAINEQHQCLKRLEEAVKQHRVVEKFREKKWQQYQTEVLQEEQKLLDEIGIQLHVR